MAEDKNKNTNVNNNDNVEVDKDKEVETNKDNKETKQQGFQLGGGIDISQLAAEEDEPEVSKTTRTLVACPEVALELIKNIFIPLGINEENGLLQVINDTDEEGTESLMLKWDTAKLSLASNEDMNQEETIIKNTIIENLLYGRNVSGLLIGITDYQGNKFPVLNEQIPIISHAFEIVCASNQKEVQQGINLIRDTLKITSEEANSIIWKSMRPASAGPLGVNTLKVSLLVYNRSDEEMHKLSQAYKATARGKKIHKTIDKASVGIYNTAKITGQEIFIPAAEVLGASVGTLTGSAAQAIGVALSEGSNEFLNSFNLEGILNRPSTQELKHRLFGKKQNMSRGGEW